MKILWMSDSPTSASGFGNITRFACAGLGRLGHEVSILGWEQRNRPQRRRLYTVFPFTDGDSDADVVLKYLRQLRPDVLVTAADPWRVSYIANPAITRFMRKERIVWALYYPIDSDKGRKELPPSLIQLLKAVDLPIVMSRYGQELTQANGVIPAYIPPGVDPKSFGRPADKVAAKCALGYDGRFVILSDARNQRRKLWPRTLEIFRRFAASKDDVLLHLHCDPYDPAASLTDYCYDLLSDIEFLRLNGKVRFTRGMSITRGTSLSRLAALYQAADVHLLASYGEGFGLPTLQAAAAGVVPLGTDYSANRELLKGHGEAIRVKGFVRDQSNMLCALIDIDAAVRSLERLYENRRLLESKSKASRRFAEAYSWGHIAAQWHDLLNREVPRLRKARSLGRVSIRLPGRARGSNGLHRGRSGKQRVPDELEARIKELERKGQYLSADILRDASNLGSPFTIPVTLPPVDPVTQIRVTGRVYLASVSDVLVFRRLSSIFPGLSAWSTVKIDWSVRRETAVTPTLVPAESSQFPAHLATSTLALDVAGTESTLPRQAAELGVPLVSLSSQSDQQWLWPDLTLTRLDVRKASEKGRRMLTDQCDAMTVCALARKRLWDPGSILEGQMESRKFSGKQIPVGKSRLKPKS